MKGCSFVLLFSISTLYLSAQTHYTGRVVEQSSKKPLESVAVTLLAADSSVVSYTYTDVHGAFEVEKVERGRLLSFSSMSYARLFLPVDKYKNGAIVSLKESPLKIKEVKVTTQRIRQQNDTLIYLVSGFKTPQDRSIEDVLKRMPGIEVADNGAIKFQGKLINKFYVEGMDLLGSRYALGSKNIPAQKVKDVQVLQNHQPIAALRGKSFSDNAALNLRLQDDAKGEWIKLIDLGIGAGHHPDVLWSNRLLAMIFGRKMQNLSMYKNDNTGKDIAREIVPLAQAHLGGQIIQMNNDEPDFFGVKTPQSSYIKQERYLFNDAHLLAINHLYKPTKNSNWRLQLTALHEKDKGDLSQQTSYYYPLETVVVDEQQHIATQENRINGELSYQLNDSSIYLKEQLQGEIGLHKSLLDVRVNGVQTTQLNHPSKRNLQNNFELIKNLGNHSLALYSMNSYSDLPQYMTVSPGLYSELLNNGEAYQQLWQEARLRSFQSSLYTYFQHKLAGWFIRYRAGITYTNKQMNSQLYVDSLMPSATNNYGNRLQLNTINLYIEPSILYKTVTWNLSFALPLSYYHAGLSIRKPTEEKQQQNNFLPTPKLTLRYTPNGMWQWNASSVYTVHEPDIHQLYAGYLFSSYRSASAYDPILALDKSWNNLVGVQFNNPLTGFFVTLSGYYITNYQKTIYGYKNVENFLSINEAHRYPYTTGTVGFRSRMSKTFAWLRLYLSAGINYARNRRKVLLNEELTSTTSKTWQLRFNYSLQPCSFLIVEGESNASHVRSKLSYAGSPTSEAWIFNHQMDMNFLFSTQWRAQLSHSIAHDNQNKRATYFMDASITYTHSAFDIEIAAHNLLNHSQLERIDIGNITTQYSNLTLRPRECLATIRFTF